MTGKFHLWIWLDDLHSGSMKATILITTVHRCMALEHVEVVNTGYCEGIILKVIPYQSLSFFFSFLRDKLIMCISRSCDSKAVQDVNKLP